jgi:ribosomal protein L12E/L44/L45/RPP1/RPP2
MDEDPAPKANGHAAAPAKEEKKIEKKSVKKEEDVAGMLCKNGSRSSSKKINFYY